MLMKNSTCSTTLGVQNSGFPACPSECMEESKCVSSEELPTEYEESDEMDCEYALIGNI